MNFESYNKKIIDLINQPQKIQEKMQSLATTNIPSEPLYAIIPNEANFQLPNVFLRTKKIVECEKFYKKYATEEKYNNNLTEVLDDFVFECEELMSTEERNVCNDQVLMEEIMKRF